MLDSPKIRPVTPPVIRQLDEAAINRIAAGEVVAGVGSVAGHANTISSFSFYLFFSSLCEKFVNIIQHYGGSL